MQTFLTLLFLIYPLLRTPVITNTDLLFCHWCDLRHVIFRIKPKEAVVKRICVRTHHVYGNAPVNTEVVIIGKRKLHLTLTPMARQHHRLDRQRGPVALLV